MKKFDSPFALIYYALFYPELIFCSCTLIKGLRPLWQTNLYKTSKLLLELNVTEVQYIVYFQYRSFEAGIFPSVLKISKVIPIFKNKGSPLEVCNYQPISLLSNIEKIYEKTMYSRLIGFLNRFEQIYSRQIGFCKKHSTTDTLIANVEQIRKKVDN